MYICHSHNSSLCPRMLRISKDKEEHEGTHLATLYCHAWQTAVHLRQRWTPATHLQHCQVTATSGHGSASIVEDEKRGRTCLAATCVLVLPSWLTLYTWLLVSSASMLLPGLLSPPHLITSLVYCRSCLVSSSGQCPSDACAVTCPGPALTQGGRL